MHVTNHSRGYIYIYREAKNIDLVLKVLCTNCLKFGLNEEFNISLVMILKNDIAPQRSSLAPWGRTLSGVPRGWGRWGRVQLGNNHTLIRHDPRSFGQPAQIERTQWITSSQLCMIVTKASTPSTPSTWFFAPTPSQMQLATWSYASWVSGLCPMSASTCTLCIVSLIGLGIEVSPGPYEPSTSIIQPSEASWCYS